MRCPSCNHSEHKVVDSRASRGGRAIRRRRECLECAHRFTTYEVIEKEPFTVLKSNGTVEMYDRHKLLKSIGIACAKRPVTATDIDGAVDRIEEALDGLDTREVTSEKLGELVMTNLQSLDQVAYVRFASVYRNFQDTTEFMEEVRELINRARYQALGQQELFESMDEVEG